MVEIEDHHIMVEHKVISINYWGFFHRVYLYRLGYPKDDDIGMKVFKVAYIAYIKG